MTTIDGTASDTATVEAIIDGVTVRVAEGTTILNACGGRGCGIPTLCYGETITPRNACRVCMVEVEGSRTWFPPARVR